MGMAKCLVHRGPDSVGNWLDPDGVIAFGHTRLAVEDLTVSGAQPMRSPSGRFVIVFNGEIYNHRDLRKELEAKGGAPRWKGTSDTETLVAAFDAWGIRGAVTRAAGMFACGVWDTISRQLFLLRDRLGEKPLYYGWSGDTFAFASELRALESLPGFRLSVNREALGLYLRFTYVPGPLSIYTGIRKLPPGSVLSVPSVPGEAGQPVAYWSLAECAAEGFARPFLGDVAEAEEELERILSVVIGQQMVADVPVGAFLSGGIDSAGVVSEMVRLSSHPVRTFTLGFGREGYDETAQAYRVAEAFGTDHCQSVITEADALSVVPELGRIYDEPFSDSSQVPTLLISRLARRHVTVALTGDGGDEIFGGYPRHGRVDAWRRQSDWLPIAVRRGLGGMAEGMAAACTALSLGRLSPDTYEPLRILAKIASTFRSRTIGGYYAPWMSHWCAVDQLLSDFDDCLVTAGLSTVDIQVPGMERTLMLLDTLTYLVDEILVKVDRAAMSTSLETRAPYLDHRVVEFAWSLPIAMLIKDGQRKNLLRALVGKRLFPLRLSPVKSGFAIPLGDWLRGGLRDWAEDLLARRASFSGVFNERVVQRVWHAHLAGRKDNSDLIWAVLMFKAWAAERDAVSIGNLAAAPGRS